LRRRGPDGQRAGFHSLRNYSDGSADLTDGLRKVAPVWERDELLKHALFLLMNGSDGDRQLSIRRAGARAFRTLPWPIFRPSARKLAADSDPEIAALGAGLLARIEELHGDE
jgi:hypothetical protein